MYMCETKQAWPDPMGPMKICLRVYLWKSLRYKLSLIPSEIALSVRDSYHYHRTYFHTFLVGAQTVCIHRNTDHCSDHCLSISDSDCGRNTGVMISFFLCFTIGPGWQWEASNLGAQLQFWRMIGSCGNPNASKLYRWGRGRLQPAVQGWLCMHLCLLTFLSSCSSSESKWPPPWFRSMSQCSK